MDYIGMDVHKRDTQVCIIDGDGAVVLERIWAKARARSAWVVMAASIPQTVARVVMCGSLAAYNTARLGRGTCSRSSRSGPRCEGSWSPTTWRSIRRRSMRSAHQTGGSPRHTNW